MEQYISKSALVAMIKRHIKEEPHSYFCKCLLSEIDTLEVKEMDLEKELDEWIKYGPHTNYPWCTIPDAIRITAEHFFELGMAVNNKAQKGE